MSNKFIEIKLKENGALVEFDMLEYARDRINKKIELVGEQAYEAALAEIGYVKERTCKLVKYSDTPYDICLECGAVQPDYTVYYCYHCGAKVVK